MIQKYFQQALQYRRDEGFKDGVVIFYFGELQGWMNELRDPQRWQPGCVAITPDELVYVSVGGNDYDGAREWVLSLQLPGDELSRLGLLV